MQTVIPLANAALIAAAPDLLAACEAMLSDLNTLEELSALHLNELPEPLAMDTARAAIAKAKGQP